MRLTQERLAALFDVLNHAATTAPELQTYLTELTQRRAHYTRLIAEHLAEIGGLRQELAVQTAADTLFALNSSEFFLLLARDRNWHPDQFEGWLADTWKRLLLPTPTSEEICRPDEQAPSAQTPTRSADPAKHQR